MRTVFSSLTSAIALGTIVPVLYLGPDSARAEDLSSSSSATQENAQAAELPERPILPPIRHYIAGEGQSLELEGGLAEKFLGRHNFTKEDLDFGARGRAAVEKVADQFKKYLETPQDQMLPCFESKTTRTEISLGVEMDSDAVISDYLIVTPLDIPKSGVSAFGERVMLFVYDLEDPKSSVRDIARGLGATCLPFRIRGTSKYVYHHFGKDALRNFDPAKKEEKSGRGNKNDA